jgi:hypothetical protein
MPSILVSGDEFNEFFFRIKARRRFMPYWGVCSVEVQAVNLGMKVMKKPRS